MSESRSQDARRGDTGPLDERIVVRFPALARRLSAAWAQLPRHSRLRRTMLARRLRQAYAAANRRDFDFHFTFLIGAVGVLVDAGERVVFLLDLRMRGRSTGMEVPLGKHAWVSTFRHGLIVHQKLYMSQSEALEAVALSE